MATTKVVVVPYDPAWPAQFAAIRASLAAALAAAGTAYISIEHVGSTSVPGLWAKPQLDIDVVVADDGRGVVFADGRTAAAHDDDGRLVTADSAAAREEGAGGPPSALGAAIAALEAAGYEHRGELGVPRRHRLRARRPRAGPRATCTSSRPGASRCGTTSACATCCAPTPRCATSTLPSSARWSRGGARRGWASGEYVEGKTEVVQRILERAGMGEEGAGRRVGAEPGHVAAAEGGSG